MNSLTWLLTPRSRASSLDRGRLEGEGAANGEGGSAKARQDKGKGKATAAPAAKPELAHGPREEESEAVDELLGDLERSRGRAAANIAERKASMGRDGTVRLGVPGITERRRVKGLELALDGGERRSELEQGGELGRESREVFPEPPMEATKEEESSPMLPPPTSAPPTPPLAPVDLPPLPPSPVLGDRAPLLDEDEDPTPPSTPPPAPTPPSSSLVSSAPPLPLLPSPPVGGKPQASHLAVEKRSRIVARSLPVRWSVKLYLLIRRFLSLFGVRLPRTEEHVMIRANEADDEKTPLLRIHLAHDDEKATPLNSPSRARKQSSSYFPFFRRSAPESPTIDEKSSSTQSTSPWKRRPRLRTDSSASFTSSDGGSESDSSVRGRRSWFGTPFSQTGTPSRQATPTPDSAGKAAASGKKLEALLRRPKTLVLDLDETLIHSTSRLGGMGGVAASAGGWGNGSAGGLKVRVIEVVLDGRIVVYHVYKRPWVDFFLKKVSSWYTIVIFTASLREYADPVIDWLDAGRGIVGGRLFRESCTNIGGSYVKDLAIVDPDLSQVCLVDNSPVSYGLNQANGIPIEGWLNDPHDEGLLDLLPMLDSLRFTNDVRRVLGLRGFSIGAGTTGGYGGARVLGRRR